MTPRRPDPCRTSSPRPRTPATRGRRSKLWRQPALSRWQQFLRHKPSAFALPAGWVRPLSRDCDHWWRTTPLKYLLDLFFRNCVDLKSLSLMRLDFGGLRAPGAKLSHGYFPCANLRGANLANSNLDYTSFMATDLGYVDFSGADLRHSCLFYADVSGAIFDQNTIIDDPGNLLKACIKPDDKGVLNGIKSTNPGISKIASQILKCPDVENRCGELGKVNGWACGN
jgi:hypothetical protein